MTGPLILQIPGTPLPGSHEPVPMIVESLCQALARAEAGETIAYALVELSDTMAVRVFGHTSTGAETNMVLGGLTCLTTRISMVQLGIAPNQPGGQDA